MTHTFLFQEGRWQAFGVFIDSNGRKVDLTGYADITHASDRWLNHSKMVVALEPPVTFENRYQIVPLRPGQLETRWSSVNPDVGRLEGFLSVVGDSLMFEYGTDDRLHHGSEYLRQLDGIRYVNRGVFYSGGRRASSWLAELTWVEEAS